MAGIASRMAVSVGPSPVGVRVSALPVIASVTSRAMERRPSGGTPRARRVSSTRSVMPCVSRVPKTARPTLAA